MQGNQEQRSFRDTEAENRSIGALIHYGLYDPPAFAELSVRLTPDMFLDPFLVTLLDALKQSYVKFGKIDPGYLVDHCRPAHGHAAAEIARLLTLYDSPALLGSPDYFVNKLKEMGHRRAVADAIWAGVSALNADATASEAVEKIQSTLLQQMAGVDGMSPSVSAAIVGAECLKQWLEISNKGANIIPTGFRQLDKYIGGLFPEQLVIVAARTSEGKSVLLQQIADHAALGGRRVLYVNLEMSIYEIWARHLAQQISADLTPLLRGTSEEVRINKSRVEIETANQAFMSSGLNYINSSSVKISDIGAEARRLKLTKGLDLIVVDYLQLLAPESRQASREREVAAMAEGLKWLARELKVPVLVAAQLNRKSAYDRTGTAEQDEAEFATPQLHHMRESGAIEQVADVAILIARTNREEYLEVAKNRNGPRYKKVPIWFDADHVTFHERQLSEEYEEHEGKYGYA